MKYLIIILTCLTISCDVTENVTYEIVYSDTTYFISANYYYETERSFRFYESHWNNQQVLATFPIENLKLIKIANKELNGR